MDVRTKILKIYLNNSKNMPEQCAWAPHAWAITCLSTLKTCLSTQNFHGICRIYAILHWYCKYLFAESLQNHFLTTRCGVIFWCNSLDVVILDVVRTIAQLYPIWRAERKWFLRWYGQNVPLHDATAIKNDSHPEVRLRPPCVPAAKLVMAERYCVGVVIIARFGLDGKRN
jgi:hypothetical protein